MAQLTRRNLLMSAPLALALTGCGKNSGQKGNVVLLRGNGPDPDSLDPHRARSFLPRLRACRLKPRKNHRPDVPTVRGFGKTVYGSTFPPNEKARPRMGASIA